jgi:elongation factor Ts
VRTWFAENVLTEQPFVKDESKTVGQLLGGAGLTLKQFVRLRVGEVVN